MTTTVSFTGFLIALCFTAQAQVQLYTSQESTVSFFSEAPLENIEAKNAAGTSRISVPTNDIAVRIPIKAFRFEKKLMEEHFNENYMESGKYPHATFAGKIQEKVDFSRDGTYDVTAKGKMNMHGVEKEVTLTGKLTVKGTTVQLYSEFMVRLEDYNIKIPSLVVKNIAEEVLVKVDISYIPYERKK